MDWASLPGSVINCCNDSAIVPIEAGLARRPREGLSTNFHGWEVMAPLKRLGPLHPGIALISAHLPARASGLARARVGLRGHLQAGYANSLIS